MQMDTYGDLALDGDRMSVGRSDLDLDDRRRFLVGQFTGGIVDAVRLVSLQASLVLMLLGLLPSTLLVLE